MKKNIFLLILGVTLAQGFVVTAHEQADISIGCVLAEDHAEDSCRNCEVMDEFEDFFCAENVDDEKPRTEKIKPSRMQLAMIRLGVAIALRVESVYDTLRACYRYAISWMGYEQRKA